MIKYVPEGDKFKANQLWGEGRHQLSILKNAMSFRKLQQDQRQVRFDNGTIITCLSCFGQDVINVFVPSPPAGGEPQRRKRVDIKYYPAIEVYDAQGDTATYMGVVICKGKGFDPPYEFLLKDELPGDTSTFPQSELPEIRKWWGGPERRFEDIVPKGRSEVSIVVKKQTMPVFSAPGNYSSHQTRIHRTWYEDSSANGVDCWRYFARTVPFFTYSRSELLNVNYAFTFFLSKNENLEYPGDKLTEYWNPYYYEATRITEKKPHISGIDGTDNVIDVASVFWAVNGNGSNYFDGSKTMYYETERFARKFVDDHWERDDANVTFNTVTVESEAQAAAHEAIYGNPSTYTFPWFTLGEHTRLNFSYGQYDITFSDTKKVINNARGSVMDNSDHHAIGFSERNTTQTGHHNKAIANIVECIPLPPFSVPDDCLEPESDVTATTTYGPINVIIDTIVYEIFPEETGPKLGACNVRYYRAGDRSIGLFRMADTGSFPYDYFYVYADVIHKEGEDPVRNKVFVTRVKDYEEEPDTDSSVYTIPGVTDLEGNPLYGKKGVRLIKETVTTHEIQRPEMPGLWEKEFK